MTVKSPRLAAFETLYKIQQESAYSNLSLDHLPVANGQERAFATALVRGVLERQITLDALVDKFTTGRLKPKVRVLLRMGAYQALYMDKVPVPAAVNETVELAKTVGQGYYGRMINAVLRQIAADPDLPDTPTLRYSVPQPLLAMWQKTYGVDATAAFLPYINGRAPLFLVPNSLFVTAAQLQDMLAEEGVQARLLPEKVLTVDDGFDVERSAAFQKGYFHVQDLSCYLACAALQVRPGLTVLDVCAAPGGKSFTLAEQMNNTGRLIACDLHPHRVELIESGARRLHLDCIESRVQDATLHSRDLPAADAILCDVPCSGFGILRRKPEIRYKDLDSIKDLPALQLSILQTAATYLKPGGRLVYSTCTLHKKENEKVVSAFLDRHSAFFLAAECTRFPCEQGSDGFYYAALERQA